MELTKKLIDFGLSPTQAKIYLSIVTLKKATILQIAQHTGIQRPTIYDNMSHLINLNLINQIIDGGKKCFISENPKNILNIIEEKQKIAKEIIPLISTMSQQTTYKPKIKFYQGIDGVKKLHEISLNSRGKIIYAIYNYSSLISFAGEKFLKAYWQKRTKKNIAAKILITDQNKKEISNNKNLSTISNIRYNREIRLTPPELKLDLIYVVVDDTVLFISTLKEDYSFVFESKSYADSIKSLFKFLWDLSSPI